MQAAIYGIGWLWACEMLGISALICFLSARRLVAWAAPRAEPTQLSPAYAASAIGNHAPLRIEPVICEFRAHAARRLLARAETARRVADGLAPADAQKLSAYADQCDRSAAARDVPNGTCGVAEGCNVLASPEVGAALPLGCPYSASRT